MSTHENFSRTAPAVQPSSDRTFGLVMSAFFLFASVWPLLHAKPPRVWMAVAGAAFLSAALTHAALLGPLNRGWTAVASGLHKIVSPVVLGTLFFLVVTPIAIGMRWFKRDALRLRLEPSAATYWLRREPLEPESMLHQF